MSIYKRRAVWWANFFMNGKRFRLSLETGDRREALRLEKELIGKASEGKLAAPGTPFFHLSFGEAMDRYLEERKPRLATKTVKTEKKRSRILKPRLGGIPVKKFDADLVLRYMAERK